MYFDVEHLRINHPGLYRFLGIAAVLMAVSALALFLWSKWKLRVRRRQRALENMQMRSRLKQSGKRSKRRKRRH